MRLVQSRPLERRLNPKVGKRSGTVSEQCQQKRYWNLQHDGSKGSVLNQWINQGKETGFVAGRSKMGYLLTRIESTAQSPPGASSGDLWGAVYQAQGSAPSQSKQKPKLLFFELVPGQGQESHTNIRGLYMYSHD